MPYLSQKQNIWGDIFQIDTIPLWKKLDFKAFFRKNNKIIFHTYIPDLFQKKTNAVQSTLLVFYIRYYSMLHFSTAYSRSMPITSFRLHPASGIAFLHSYHRKGNTICQFRALCVLASFISKCSFLVDHVRNWYPNSPCWFSRISRGNCFCVNAVVMK